MRQHELHRMRRSHCFLDYSFREFRHTQCHEDACKLVAVWVLPSATRVASSEK